MKTTNIKEGSLTKEKLLEMLEIEAEKSEDEIDVERINVIITLLDECEERKNSPNDYEEFLRRFNERNGTQLKNRQKSQKASIFKRYAINYAESARIATCIAASVLLIAINLALGIANINPAYSIGVRAYSSIIEIVNDYIDFDKIVYTLKHVGEDKFDKIDNYYVSYDEVDLKDLDIMQPSYIPDGYVLNSATSFKANGKINNIEIIYNNLAESYLSYNVQILYNQNHDFIMKNPTGYSYKKTIEFNGISIYIYTNVDNKALFFADNNLYTVVSDMDVDEFCEVLKSFSFN